MIAWYDRIGNSIEMKLYEDADSPEFKWVKGSVIEGYRYRDGIVSMKSDDGRIIWCGVKSSDFRKSEDSLGDFISNADRIRNMTDEELADFLMDISMGMLFDKKIMNVKSWLQSEVEE